ncbi:MAG: hypothetical protein CMJ47_08680 [Planctomyces sp.]|nr:hypothetical protein [Planctomyces sp.]
MVSRWASSKTTYVAARFLNRSFERSSFFATLWRCLRAFNDIYFEDGVSTMFCKYTAFCSVALTLALMAGCGRAPATDAPDLLPVAGKVVSNGQPLADAIVEFTPEAGGATSTSVTDSEGYFELVYSDGRKGAVSGQHRVRVTEPLASTGEGAQTEMTISAKPPEETVQMVVVKDEDAYFEFTL